MMLRFVTSSPGKLAEARARLGPLGVEVRGVKKRVVEIQADSLDEVARHKAAQLLGALPAPFFLEDAGLQVEALAGFPGVYSHYAFQTIGCEGILRLLRGVPRPKRRARFRAVIAYADSSQRIRLFAGEAAGHVVDEPRGRFGFGFDPIFKPEGGRRTFAELRPPEKGRVSHRGRALDALHAHLARATRGKKP